MKISKALVRYQFLELFVRIADRRYIKSKKAETKAEAVEMMMEKHVKPHLTNKVWNYWRQCFY